MKKTFEGKAVDGKKFALIRFQMILTFSQSEKVLESLSNQIATRKRALFEEKSFDLFFSHFGPFGVLQLILEHFQV